jgi:hypothetical protein
MLWVLIHLGDVMAWTLTAFGLVIGWAAGILASPRSRSAPSCS